MTLPRCKNTVIVHFYSISIICIASNPLWKEPEKENTYKKLFVWRRRWGLESDEDYLKSNFKCVTNHYQVLNSVLLVVCIVAMGSCLTKKVKTNLCISFPDEKPSLEFVYQSSKSSNSATGESEVCKDLLTWNVSWPSFHNNDQLLE